MDLNLELSPEGCAKAFFDYLVLPALSQQEEDREISEELEEKVAKQMYALVILYNYYLHESYPRLDIIEATKFCKCSAAWNFKMVSFLNALKGSQQNSDKTPSFMELSVKEACDTATLLRNTEKDSSIYELWKVSKIAVFVVNRSLTKCVLVEDTITLGCWSLVESDLPDPRSDTEVQAFAAVCKETGLSRVQLRVKKERNTLVKSITKKQSLCRLYFMICEDETSLKSDSAKWVEITEAFSFEEPLIDGDYPDFMANSSVSYFHLRPYESLIRKWLKKMQTLGELMDVNCNDNGNGHYQYLFDDNIHPPSLKPSLRETGNRPSPIKRKSDHIMNGNMNIKFPRPKMEHMSSAGQNPASVEYFTPHSGKVTRISMEGKSNGASDKKVTDVGHHNYDTLKSIQRKYSELTIEQKACLEKLNRISDEMDNCYDKMQMILSGEQTNKELDGINVVETNFASRRKASMEREGNSGSSKRARFSEGIFSMRSSCKELHEICTKNSWSVDYKVIDVSQENYDHIYAIVEIKGADFGLQRQGQLRSTEIEAQESAAATLLSCLYCERAKRDLYLNKENI